jgi:HD superfamily phosphohydrolase
MSDDAGLPPALAAPALCAQVREWLAASEATVPPLGSKAKHIRDPLYGSIVLGPHEIRLLDTLPMQRLRGVHQLGLAYLTFPSARHTRFEHALGVRFIAERMLDRLEDVRGSYAPEQRATVLAAALLHDVGHGVFSHVIEGIITDHPWLREQFADDGPWHEQIGAALVQSAPLAAILREMEVDPVAVAALLRHHIPTLRARVVPAELWGIISGPLDADKLDYFARDSYFSGVVSAVDPDRILRTLAIGPDHQLAITLAGASALDQMLFDRVRMYADLYGHQKILAAEAMVRSLVEIMLTRGPHGKRSRLFVRGRDGRSVELRLDRVTDFLRASDEAFLAAPTDNAAAARVQERLLRRELLHRAYTLSFESVRGADEATYLRAVRPLRRPERLEALRQAIHARHPDVPLADLGVACVRGPSMERVGASVVGRDGNIERNGTAFAAWDEVDGAGLPVHSIQRHFELYHARIFVFCPPELVATIGPTARELLQEAWGDAPGTLV